MTISIPNNHIACQPVTISVEKENRSGFATVKQKTQLLQTMVVFGSSDPVKNPYKVGDFVYLRGDVSTLAWARNPFEIGGKKVILVPCDQIVALESRS